MASDRLAATEIARCGWNSAFLGSLLILRISLTLRLGACGVLVSLLLISALQANYQRVHNEATSRAASRSDLRRTFVLIVSEGRRRLPIDVLLHDLLRGLSPRGFVTMSSSDWRRLNVEVDAAEPSENTDVVDAVVGARCVIIRLVGLVVQLFLHVRIQQVEVVDVVDLDLGSESCTVAEEDGSSC